MERVNIGSTERSEFGTQRLIFELELPHKPDVIPCDLSFNFFKNSGRLDEIRRYVILGNDKVCVEMYSPDKTDNTLWRVKYLAHNTQGYARTEDLHLSLLNARPSPVSLTVGDTGEINDLRFTYNADSTSGFSLIFDGTSFHTVSRNYTGKEIAVQKPDYPFSIQCSPNSSQNVLVHRCEISDRRVEFCYAYAPNVDNDFSGWEEVQIETLKTRKTLSPFIQQIRNLSKTEIEQRLLTVCDQFTTDEMRSPFFSFEKQNVVINIPQGNRYRWER